MLLQVIKMCLDISNVTIDVLGNLINVVALTAKFFDRMKSNHRIGNTITKPREGITSNVDSGMRRPEGVDLEKISKRRSRRW